MKGKRPIKITDIVIILLAFGLTGFSAFSAYLKPEHAIRVMIQGQTETWIFPMEAEETVSVRGPLGTTVIKIHEKQAWVESSPCTNQTCVASGHIKTRGTWVACLPNNVFLLIEGNDASIVDTVAW